MHSPLPDSSALEAGIIEDSNPSRLSRVQDNVRHLLRASRFGASSVASTPPATPTHQSHQPVLNHEIPTSPLSPLHRASTHHHHHQPEVTFAAESPPSTASSTPQNEEISGILFPPFAYQSAVQQMARQSTLFNTRAVAALDHPDLADPLALTLAKQKAFARQRRAWKRPRNGSGAGMRGESTVVKVESSQCVLCVLAALLLAATVATYIVLASTSTDVAPSFHILFVLGILLATIVFAHTVVRLFLFGNSNLRSKRKVFLLPVSHVHHRRRHRHHGYGHRAMPSLSDDLTDFVPAEPIQIHMPPTTEEVRPDSREARPTTKLFDAVSPHNNDNWNKDTEGLANPPPAYGKWRGSVRANPDLLHWQAVPSPVDAELQSPTYEEAVAGSGERTGPPSYVTRDSPARRRELRDEHVARVQSQVVEPEMVEVRVGVSMAV